MLQPISDQIKSEPEIIANIAHAYFEGNHAMPWKDLGQDYEAIRVLIDKTIKGFQKTSKQSKGHGYYLPNNAREADFSKLPNGKVQLTLNPVERISLQEDSCC